MRNSKVRDMILIAMFAALTAVGGLFKIQLPYASITLQFFFCAFAGVFLGAKKGALSQVLYLVIGLSGVPIFAEGGGIMYVLKPSFGYLIGLMPCAYMIGHYIEKGKRDFIHILGIMVAGMLVVYMVGVPYLYLIVRYYLGSAISISSALSIGLLPFIVPDLIKSVVAALIYKKVEPALIKQGIGDR